MDGGWFWFGSEDAVGLEQPDNDVFEQRLDVPPPPPELAEAQLPLEADQADAVEQIDEVEVDDEV